MRERAWVAAACLVCLLASCSRPSAEEYTSKAQQALEQARSAADTLHAGPEKAAIFEPAIASFRRIVTDFPDSVQAELSQFMIATIRNNDTRQPELAIHEYRKYLELYPDGSQAPLAMFMIGYLYNNDLHQLDSAAAAYRQFLQKYPQHEMALTAQFELSTLGKTPDELLHERMDGRATAPSATGPKRPRERKAEGAAL